MRNPGAREDLQDLKSENKMLRSELKIYKDLYERILKKLEG